MTATPGTSNPTTLPMTAESGVGSGALPPLDVALGASEVLERLDAAARRGKMPGFHRGTESGGEPLFTVTDFGTPFESVLEAKAEGRSGGLPGCRINFQLRLKPKMIWVFAAILVTTVWPGIWLTDSMLRTYFSWYQLTIWQTCIWYLPLTVPFVPLGLWSAVKKSRASGMLEARELIERVRVNLTQP